MVTKYKVIILDDDTYRSQQYVDQLNMRGFDAATTDSIPKVLELATFEEYDAFILDIQMNDTTSVFSSTETYGGWATGLALYHKLRDIRTDVKMVALTYSNLPEAVEWFTHDESVDYFNKEEYNPKNFPEALYHSLNHYYENIEDYWYDDSKKCFAEYPYESYILDSLTINGVFIIVQQICQQFKKLVEENGLCELLYDNNKKNAKHERAAQQLFFGIADSYCTANNIDLTRESNVGRGPVDFKLSKGSIEKVLVEVKLTSNEQLKHGIETQLPIYMAQEKTQKAIYLVIDNGHPRALENFYKFHNNLDPKVKQSIPFVVIDGILNKESASKASRMS